MKHKFPIGRCRRFLSVMLLLAVFVSLHAQTTPTIKNIRTVIYSAVMKDTLWVTGSVVDHILFVKYDSEGRKIVENSLKPDGSPYAKVVYLYNDSGRVSREIFATGGAGVTKCWDYSYNDAGRINKIIERDGQEQILQTRTVQYDIDGKVVLRTIEDLKEGWVSNSKILYDEDGKSMKIVSSGTRVPGVMVSDAERWDTVSLRRESAKYYNKMQVVRKNKEQVTMQDTCGNWTQKMLYDEESETPDFIVERDIVYVDEGNDWEKVPLHDKVKRVSQMSYVAIPQGPETVDKGAKKGKFFVYEYNEQGRKMQEETFSETGILTGKIKYEYDEIGRLLKETFQTPKDVVVEHREYLYNKEGELKTCSVQDAQGELLRRDVFRYDLEGNCVHEMGYHTNGTTYKEYRYVFDSYGQLVGRQVLLSPENEPPVYPFRRSWSFNGRIAEEQILLFPGVERNNYTYRYNSLGEMVSGTEQLGEQPQTAFVYKFLKDEHGNWRIRIKYVEGVPVVYEVREYQYYDSK